MRNGYALCTRHGLDAIGSYLHTLDPERLDLLRGKLSIGLHRDVEVTDANGEKGLLVSQAFCSALPVQYTSIPAPIWKPFATLVLEAAYEATMWAAAENAQRGKSNVVFLTSLGAGAFGNDETWVHVAVRRALQVVSKIDPDVRLVSYRTPPEWFGRLAKDFR